MQISESICNLRSNAQRALRSDSADAGASKLCEGVIKGAAPHELGDEEEAVGCRMGDDAKELCDAGVAKGGIAGGLATELNGGGEGLGCGVIGKVADFDGDGGAGVGAAPDGAEGAAAEGARGEVDLGGIYAGGSEREGR